MKISWKSPRDSKIVILTVVNDFRWFIGQLFSSDGVKSYPENFIEKYCIVQKLLHLTCIK